MLRTIISCLQNKKFPQKFLGTADTLGTEVLPLAFLLKKKRNIISAESKMLSVRTLNPDLHHIKKY